MTRVRILMYASLISTKCFDDLEVCMDGINGMMLLPIVFAFFPSVAILVWGIPAYICVLRGMKKTDEEIARDKMQKEFEEIFRKVPRE